MIYKERILNYSMICTINSVAAYKTAVCSTLFAVQSTTPILFQKNEIQSCSSGGIGRTKTTENRDLLKSRNRFLGDKLSKVLAVQNCEMKAGRVFVP